MFYRSFFLFLLTTFFSINYMQASAELAVLVPMMEKIDWSLNEEQIIQFREYYKNKSSRDEILRKFSRYSLYAGGAYATYWVSSGLLSWLLGNKASSALPDLKSDSSLKDVIAKMINISGRLTDIEKQVNVDGFIVSQLKMIGSILAMSYITLGFGKVFSFATNSVYKTYLEDLKSRRVELFNALEYSADQMAIFQDLDDEIFENHKNALDAYVTKFLIPFCHEYVGLLQALSQAMPEPWEQYKLTTVPDYVFSLFNKKLSELKNRLDALQDAPKEGVLVSDIKQIIELLKTEVGSTMTRVILVAEL